MKLQKLILVLLIGLLAVQKGFAQPDKQGSPLIIGAAMWQDGLQLLESPVKAKWHHWLIAAGAGGAVAFTAYNDQSLFSEIASKDLEYKHPLNPVGEAFGNPIYTVSALSLSYLAAYYFNEPEGEWAQTSSVALRSVVLSGAITMGLKLAFHRVRPREQSHLDPYLFYGPSFRRENLSFPSGHTTIAFALASSISEYQDNVWYWSIPLYSLATLTAWQRIYSHEHWPSDVLAGAFIGFFTGRAIARWQKGRSAKRLSSLQLASSSVGLGLGLAWQID